MSKIKTRYKIERGVKVNRTKLHPNPWNPNRTNNRTQQAISESIGHFGQVLEILVRPHPENHGEYEIIDGEHRYNVLPDEVYVNVIHDLPDAEAKKLTIIMNETKGDADKIELAQLLASIKDELSDEDLILGLPYEESELQELIKLADYDWNNFNSSFTSESTENLDDGGDGFTTLTVTVPNEAIDVINQARGLISQQRKLNSKDSVAWGQVLESLAADFLAIPN